MSMTIQNIENIQQGHSTTCWPSTHKKDHYSTSPANINKQESITLETSAVESEQLLDTYHNTVPYHVGNPVGECMCVPLVLIQ